LKPFGQWFTRPRGLVDGLENAPRAFIRMLEGKNIGKQLVKVGE
jgi:NADPH-dependent curcumin reductase CurA